MGGPGATHLDLAMIASLDRLNVLRLQTLGSLGHAELHALTFLQALEAARLNRRKMHEYVFPVFAANKSKSLGIVEPLYCSLFHVV